ncbi:MAG: hypothetical protein CMI00_01095 [Oceanospirillaceae bacterium]|nr:hypothetical protein [Oceanospirillaceae bacterium]|tara:strand:+ start:9458 stop:9718 length:261 start_codon:yes stop_codon:yes gene_type:complete
MSLKTWCEAQIGKEKRFLTWFSVGATLFFAGAGVMLLAEYRIVPSLGQELVALAGVILAGLGVLLALYGYIMLMLLRLFGPPPDSR